MTASLVFAAMAALIELRRPNRNGPHVHVSCLFTHLHLLVFALFAVSTVV